MSYLVSTSVVETSRVVERFDVARCLAWFSPITGLGDNKDPCLPTTQAAGSSGASR
jgi:hypothetical protein